MGEQSKTRGTTKTALEPFRQLPRIRAASRVSRTTSPTRDFGNEILTICSYDDVVLGKRMPGARCRR